MPGLAADGRSEYARSMIFEKTARDTITAVEMNAGDELHFTLADGTTRRIVLRRTWAHPGETTLSELGRPEPWGRLVYRIYCTLEIDGVEVSISREIGSQRTFDPPRTVMGLQIWLDTVDDIFEFLQETHGACRPRKQLRLGIQDASRRICPVLLHPWCPLPDDGLRIEDCYRGDDCWMGAYDGADAHGGLDINHPAGTPIWAPIAFDDHELFNTVAGGDNNNRWRGIHRWQDGSAWILQVHHVVVVHPPENTPIEAGALVADGAGVHIGAYEHSHFVFRVVEPGCDADDSIYLDPWLLFRQMYIDRELTAVR
jgi:hypothetical protein